MLRPGKVWPHDVRPEPAARTNVMTNVILGCTIRLWLSFVCVRV
jgi:hypothetical protein